MIRVTWNRTPIHTIVANVGESEGEINQSFSGNDIAETKRSTDKNDNARKIEKQESRKTRRNGSIDKLPGQHNEKNEMTQL